ncbi:MAG: hypothetical protein NTZ34_03875 [Chloroflexi bacterium]|nr:hypothetical protein [Chloroflexota bacterium]
MEQVIPEVVPVAALDVALDVAPVAALDVAPEVVPVAALDVDYRDTDYNRGIDNNTGIDMYMDWSGR